MDFKKQKPIYHQIADMLCDRIVGDEWKAEERIPSVRDVAIQLGVNPNTVMRVYEKLTAEGIIYNKRGIGYFVSGEAREKILDTQRQEFLEKEVPTIRRKMDLLGLDASIFNK